MLGGIADEGGRVIETHGLVVEQGAQEGGRVVRLEVGRGVGDERERGGVRFGKTVERERFDARHDFLLRGRRNLSCDHAGAQILFDFLHAFGGALESHGAPELLGLSAGKSRCRHGHADELFLEQWHAQGALQDRLQTGVRIGDRRAAVAALQVGADHLAHDGTRPNDGHLNHQVIEAFGPQARQSGHLCARFHLEHAHRVRGAQHAIDLSVVGGQMGVVDGDALVLEDERDRILQHGQHAQPEQVHLDDAQIRAVVLVPLDHHPARHGGRLQGHDLVERAATNHHAARVLAQMAWQIEHGSGDGREMARAFFAVGETRLAQIGRKRRVAVPQPVGQMAGHAGQLFLRKAQGAARIAHRHLGPIGDHVGGHGGAARAILAIHVLNDLFAPRARRQIQVDVGHAIAHVRGGLDPFFGQEAFEEQVHAHWIHGRDTERVAGG